MKTVYAIITLFIVSPLHSQIEALFDLKKFHSSESNYIETYLFIYGNTLFENQDSNFKNKGVEVLLSSAKTEKIISEQASLEIDVSLIIKSPYQPRTIFEEESLKS